MPAAADDLVRRIAGEMEARFRSNSIPALPRIRYAGEHPWCSCCGAPVTLRCRHHALEPLCLGSCTSVQMLQPQ